MAVMSATKTVQSTFLFIAAAGAVKLFSTMNENMVSWSGEQDEILIDFVKNHEILYNITNKPSSNKTCGVKSEHP